MSTIFGNRTEVTVRALFVGQRIDLREYEKGQVLARGPLLVSTDGGYAVLFRYGVVVLFGLDAEEEAGYLADIHPLVTEPLASVERDEVVLVAAPDESEGVVKSRIILHEFDYHRLQLVADVLAKSVVLSYYEAAISKSFDLVEPLAKTLKEGGSGGHQVKELIRHIGNTLSIQGKMVGRAEITEKPELLWEQPQYERLFVRLEDEYELRERFEAQERKLALISTTAETLLGLLQEKRTLRVEWYIVFLIVFEILLTLYEMWHKT